MTDTHTDIGWLGGKDAPKGNGWYCSCGEQFASREAIEAHTPYKLRIRP